MYSITKRIKYSELGEDKLLSLVALINCFQDCSNFESEDKSVGLKWLSEQKRVWMLTSWQIKVNRYPALGETVNINTWACGFRGFVGQRNFTMEKEDGELLAYAYSNWAYINTETGAPAKVPEKELEVYGTSAPLEKEFEKGKLIFPENAEKLQDFEIRHANIDTNHHVNNGQYVALAEDFLPQGFRPYGLRAEYKMQARLGDVITPYRADTDKGIIIRFTDGEINKPYVTMRFNGKIVEMSKTH